LALGQALYLRYMALENNTVSLACQACLRTWLCDTFRLTIVLFNHNVFGWVALAAAPANRCWKSHAATSHCASFSRYGASS
jgi:type IV secretory pathway TrbD component